MLNAPALNSIAQMSSREIADLLEVRHDNVKLSIERLTEKQIISFTSSTETSHEGAGARPMIVYMVNKRDSFIVVAQMQPQFTARIVDRWQELEAKPVANLNDPAMLRSLLLGYTEQVIELQATVESQKPAVAFHECVKASINSQSIEEVAKALGTGRNRMYQWLRQSGLLKQDNNPYQEYIDRDYFEVEFRTYKDKAGKNITYPMTMVTGRGIDYIYRKFF
jgi:phage antirepressor YoqD-like protein